MKNSLCRFITDHFKFKSIAFDNNFPERLKIVKLIPFLKAEDQHHFKIHIPISLLPTFSEIFEKALFIQLYD